MRVILELYENQIGAPACSPSTRVQEIGTENHSNWENVTLKNSLHSSTSENLRLFLSLRLIVDLIYFLMDSEFPSQKEVIISFSVISSFYWLIWYNHWPSLSLSRSLFFFFFFCAESCDFSLLPTENNSNSTLHSRFSLAWPLGHISHSPHLPHRLLLSQTRLAVPRPRCLQSSPLPHLSGGCCCFSFLLAERSIFTSRVIHSLSWGLSNFPTHSTPLFFPPLLAKASLPHHSHQTPTHVRMICSRPLLPSGLQLVYASRDLHKHLKPKGQWGQKSTFLSTCQGTYLPTWPHSAENHLYFLNSIQRHGLTWRHWQQYVPHTHAF